MLFSTKELMSSGVEEAVGEEGFSIFLLGSVHATTDFFCTRRIKMIPVPHFFEINGISLALETVVAPCSSAEASVEKLRRVGVDASMSLATVAD